ncbi:hypothetical protein ES332_A08G150600v1 [Gossypium tomentosum]|uniref:Late embryogenesis abundant protein LEA-2 subgroup domain-containing protein n=1 Tax=Gossypium tomentosum TaxID=34277 RepID=A0A5D2PHU2_GOSTO|nr:hypothetical protein ES332_A08G150600v1 [Gossypium tomentosum]
MSDALFPSALNKPPGYNDPNSPAGFKPLPQKPVLPPSFRPKKKKGRVCCCCFCISFSILIALIIIFAAVFYFSVNPKLPRFHVQSFQIPRFNVTETPDGTYLDATTMTVMEVRNPNGKMTYYYGDTAVDISVGEGEDETEVGTAKVPKFTSRKQYTTSLKVETKASNKQVDNTLANRLLSGYKSKSLAVNVAARTKVGVGVAGLKTGMLGITVKCKGITMKQLDGDDMPNCLIHTLRWIKVR